jgi:hypothetical protein
MDEMFYYTMKEIKDRLANSIEVNNPNDGSQSLLLVQADRDKMDNLYSRLDTYLKKLDVLFNLDCTNKQAIEAWNEIFKHDFWEYDEKNIANAVAVVESYNSTNIMEFDDTEEFIDNIMPVNYRTKVSLNCLVYRDGKSYDNLKSMLRRNETVKIGDTRYFYVDEKSINIYGKYNVYLKVKNVGSIAERINSIRGEIFNIRSQELIADKFHKEHAEFRGDHFVECYIEVNGVCVATDFLSVPIY